MNELIMPRCRKRKKKSTNEIVFIVIMMSIPVLHFCLFWLYINFAIIAMSFQKFSMDTGKWIGNGFNNYRELWREFTKESSVLPRALLNSVSVFLWNDFVIVPVSLLCAYVLYKKMPLGGTFKVIFFLPSIISVVVLTLAYSFMFDVSLGAIPVFLEKIGENNRSSEQKQRSERGPDQWNRDVKQLFES